jgi:uncharacterized membrane protein YfcA
VALGVPSVAANVTNTVALAPGYAAGTHAQRADLAGQRLRARRLAVWAAVGGLAGSILLVTTPEHAFRDAVPYLVLLSCLLLAAGDRVRAWARRRSEAHPVPTADRPPALGLGVATFAAAVYGGFFGAGLGIMTLAILGLFLDDSLIHLNAVKQLLSLVINSVAAVFFAFSGDVRWSLVGVMAFAALGGGALGGRLTHVVNPRLLRRLVVVAGVAVAISFWVA